MHDFQEILQEGNHL